MRMSPTLALLAAAGLAAVAHAGIQPRISEMLINSPGNDNGSEFIEIIGAPNASLAGLWFVVIDGDNNATGNSVAHGRVDLAIDLSQYSLGSNGLLLLRDSATIVLSPAPAPETTVIATGDWLGCNGSTNMPPLVNVDIENGCATYLLVTNFTGAACDDLDADDDGTLDTTPWTSVVDAVAYLNGDDLRDPTLQNNISEFATQLGGTDISDRRPDIADGFTPDFFARVCDFILSTDVVGISPGPYGIDFLEYVTVPAGGVVPDDYILTPGSLNPCPNTGGPQCNSIDFNADGLFPDDGDLVDFLSVFAGGSCSNDPNCDAIDFNNDGLFPDDQDLIDFLIVLAGGTPTSCTP